MTTLAPSFSRVDLADYFSARYFYPVDSCFCPCFGGWIPGSGFEDVGGPFFVSCCYFYCSPFLISMYPQCVFPGVVIPYECFRAVPTLVLLSLLLTMCNVVPFVV